MIVNNNKHMLIIKQHFLLLTKLNKLSFAEQRSCAVGFIL